MANTFCRIWNTIGLVLLGLWAMAQQDSVPASTVTDSASAIIMRADQAIYYLEDDGQERDTLRGNVVLIQDSLYMSCEHAVVIDRIHAIAEEEIRIVQSDSLFIYADSLRYNGVDRIAYLKGRVILTSEGRALHTPQLVYDVAKRHSSFSDGATLIGSDSSRLVSKQGEYWVRTERAAFYDHVTYTDADKILRTDSLIYEYDKNKIILVAPTQIQQDSTLIYCQSGVIDTDSNVADLAGDIQISMPNREIAAGKLRYNQDQKRYILTTYPQIVQNDSTIITGDTIVYDEGQNIVHIHGNACYESPHEHIQSATITYNENTGRYTTQGNAEVSQGANRLQANVIEKVSDSVTVALGRVEFNNQEDGSTIYCQQMWMNEKLNSAKAFNTNQSAALMVYPLSEEDTMWLVADTLHSVETGSGTVFSAYHNAQMTSASFAGKMDSLAFHIQDSLLMLYEDPVLWNDSTQLSADTIAIFMGKGSIQKLALMHNAVIIVPTTQTDQFQQIKGMDMDCQFEHNTIRTTWVNADCKLINFVYQEDENTCLAINESLAVKMRFDFKNNQIYKAKFFRKQDAEAIQYNSGIDAKSYRVEGFRWLIDQRPKRTMFTEAKAGIWRNGAEDIILQSSARSEGL